jgi:hypothetical protein
LPARRLDLREYVDVAVDAGTRGRAHEVLVHGPRAVPVLIQGRMTAAQAESLAGALRECVSYYRRGAGPVEQADQPDALSRPRYIGSG